VFTIHHLRNWVSLTIAHKVKHESLYVISQQLRIVKGGQLTVYLGRCIILNSIRVQVSNSMLLPG